MTEDSALYLYVAEFPDGKHVFGGRSIVAKTDAQLAYVYNEFSTHVMQNPDVKIDPETFLHGPYATPAKQAEAAKEMVAKLDAEDPDRVSVGQLQAAGAVNQGIDLIHRPEIARMLAARKAAMKANDNALAKPQQAATLAGGAKSGTPTPTPTDSPTGTPAAEPVK